MILDDSDFILWRLLQQLRKKECLRMYKAVISGVKVQSIPWDHMYSHLEHTPMSSYSVCLLSLFFFCDFRANLMLHQGPCQYWS